MVQISTPTRGGTGGGRWLKSGGASAMYYTMMGIAILLTVVFVLWDSAHMSSTNASISRLQDLTVRSGGAGGGSSQSEDNAGGDEGEEEESNDTAESGDSTITNTQKMGVFSQQSNSQAMKAWRQKIRDACQAAKTAEQVTAVENINKVGLKMPSKPDAQPRNDRAVVTCRNVVMDFGANIGDTSGHVVDSGMVMCDRTKDLQMKTSFVHFNVETKQFEDSKKLNPLTHQLIRMMGENADLGPEDYCYYGIEGNPVFTKRLRAIEDYVMAIRPRPIQHMHFFTESVGSGQDGPTKLYLDTINEGKNFWGSSIFKGHQDVKKSAAIANSTADTIAADVMGYTIGTLMRKTLLAFDPKASPQDKKGNHLVLKVDIEGGEYPLLAQAAEEGTLCEFVQMGNRADLFIEFHSIRVTGKHDYVGKTGEIKSKLEQCGVKFRNLAAFWA